MKLSFSTDVTSKYDSQTMYVEQVGESIELVNVDDLDLQFDGTTTVSTKKDYWTINRSAINRNVWSRGNRWFHIDVINTYNKKNPDSIIETTEALRAKRPIVEFRPNIQLYNHGTKFNKVTLIDNLVTDALSQVQGTTGFRVDLPVRFIKS